MAQKSSLFEWFWWIPTIELEDENPTVFLIRQMSKKDRDVTMSRKQGETLLSTLISEDNSEELSDRVKSVLAKRKAEYGFDTELYSSCVKEIRNIYVKGEFKESLNEPKEVVEAVAGLESSEVSNELDDVLWRISTLTEVEKANFTPSSGCSSVFRTAPGARRIGS